MKKWNKRLILMLVLVLVIGVLSGCDNKKIELEGVTSKKLTKDLTKLRYLILESLSEKEYKEEKIEEVLAKINDVNYQEKLNTLEVQIIKDTNEDMKDLKKELTSGDRIITSATHEKINWLLQATTESP